MTDSAQTSPISTPATAALPALDMRFLRRTAWATVITIMLVSASAAAYYDPLWSLRYVLVAFWAIGFFTLTALIFKNLLFEGRAFSGILYTFLKIASLGAIFAINFYFWPVTDKDGNTIPGHALALALGLVTPFAVFVLRLMGFLLEFQKGGGKISIAHLLPPAHAVGSKNPAGRMK